MYAPLRSKPSIRSKCLSTYLRSGCLSVGPQNQLSDLWCLACCRGEQVAGVHAVDVEESLGAPEREVVDSVWCHLQCDQQLSQSNAERW